MADQDNAALIRGLYDAVNRKDLEAIAAFGMPESAWLDVPFDITTRGSDAIVVPWEAWFKIFPDAHCEVQRLVALGDHVVAQGIGSGTHLGPFHSPAGLLPPSGRRMSVRFCDVYQLRDGRILRADSYFDFHGLLAQLRPAAIAA
jgi:predicted ester cyclase